jgi:hypothetical protein
MVLAILWKEQNYHGHRGHSSNPPRKVCQNHEVLKTDAETISRARDT